MSKPKEEDFVVNQDLIDKVVTKETERQMREFLKLPKNPVHKLTHEDAVKVWVLWRKEGLSLGTISLRFEVSESSIRGIIRGEYHPEAANECMNKGAV